MSSKNITKAKTNETNSYENISPGKTKTLKNTNIDDKNKNLKKNKEQKKNTENDYDSKDLNKTNIINKTKNNISIKVKKSIKKSENDINSVKNNKETESDNKSEKVTKLIKKSVKDIKNVDNSVIKKNIKKKIDNSNSDDDEVEKTYDHNDNDDNNICENYDNNNIDEEVDKVDNDKKKNKRVKKKTTKDQDIKKELKLQKIDGSKIWTKNNEFEYELKDHDESEENELKIQFDSLIKQCHQILYNNGAIVGKKAMDDIMKILTLKLLQPLFEEGQSIKIKYDEYVNTLGEDEDISQYYEKCLDIMKIAIEDDPLDEWKCMVRFLLSKILDTIYDCKDYSFNGNEMAIKEVICKIDSCKVFKILTKEEGGIKYYDSVSGQIYEYFMNKYVSGGGKDLGQFFTPRKMINLMFYGLDIKKYINVNEDTTIYDPCAGSGGFLTRIYNCFPIIKPENIYGGEIEKDTMKFCISNLLLTTGTYCENLVNMNSITYEDGLKHDLILTNPPFGTSMKYKKHIVKEGGKNVSKNGLMEEFNKVNKNKEIKFTDIYPIQTNDGACLFTQKCVYKLKKNGLLCIVLPDGQLFFGKNFAKFRKWLSEQMNIIFIVQAASGVFEHAGIKTCIILARKDGKTKKIQFLKTDKECSYLEKVVEISEEDLSNGDYSMDPKDYIEEKIISDMINVSSVEWKELGELCEFKSGKYNTKDAIENGEYPLYTSRLDNPSHKIDKYCFNDLEYILFLKSGGNAKNTQSLSLGIGSVYYVKCKSAANSDVIQIKAIDDKIIKYLYTYLKSKKLDIQTLANYGTNLGHIDMNKFKKIKIPLPSLEIQQHIVNEFYNLDRETETLKQLLQQTKEEKQMYNKYAFIKDIRELLVGCEWNKFGDVFILEKGKTQSGKVKENIDGCAEFINWSIYKNYKKINNYKIDGNNLFISTVMPNGGVNKCYLVLILYKGKCDWCDLMSLCKIKNEYKNKINIEMYFYYLTYLKDHIEKNYQKGSCNKSLHIDRFNNMQIPIPSIDVQKKCILIYQKKEIRLNQYDEEINSLEEKLQQLHDLGKHVIEYYISGDNQQMIKTNDENSLEYTENNNVCDYMSDIDDDNMNNIVDDYFCDDNITNRKNSENIEESNKKLVTINKQTCIKKKENLLEKKELLIFKKSDTQKENYTKELKNKKSNQGTKKSNVKKSLIIDLV